MVQHVVVPQSSREATQQAPEQEVHKIQPILTEEDNTTLLSLPSMLLSILLSIFESVLVLLLSIFVLLVLLSGVFIGGNGFRDVESTPRLLATSLRQS